MQTKVFEVPTLYGDHHVQEVRRILLEIPGVNEVYASSAFQMIEVMYDETKTNDLELSMKLDEAGYLGEWSFPTEIGAIPGGESTQKPFFRHTQSYEATRYTVSFAQNTGTAGRPLWPCPGMGIIRRVELEE